VIRPKKGGRTWQLIQQLAVSQTAQAVIPQHPKGKDIRKRSGQGKRFLKLLVTQMQYQDPLNPSDNTEYMSQLAQYSALEAQLNISDTLDKGKQPEIWSANM